MKYDINKIYKMINWDNSPEIQLQGIQLAEQIEDISYFIQPKEGKEIWENCAKILSSKCDDILEPYLVPLIEWLQDINWPGALLIYDRLTRLSANKLLKPFIKCFDKAFANEANEWLDCLAGFINNIEFYEILPDKYRKTLTKHYNNFGKQMKSNKTLSMYENKTIINYENKEKVESIDFHDSNFNSFKYDYILKQINIILRNEFINKNYELLFENVI